MDRPAIQEANTLRTGLEATCAVSISRLDIPGIKHSLLARR